MRVERARYFLATVEAGSLRAAAARCGVSQPTIGQQITLLEEELDCLLLTRSKHGVRLTPAGEALLGPLRRLVEAEDAVRDSAMDASGAYHGRVRVGSVSVTAETIVAPVVGQLRTKHPGLRFTVHEGASADVEAAVRDGELDFGVITVPSTPPATGLRRIPLVSSPLGVCARVDHPLAEKDSVSWDDLEGRPVVTMRAGTVLWEMLHRNVASPNVVVQAMSARTVKVMVGHGAGVGVLAHFDTSADIPDLRWIPLRAAEPVRLCLTQRADSQPSRAALIVQQLVRVRAGELAGQRSGSVRQRPSAPTTGSRLDSG